MRLIISYMGVVLIWSTTPLAIKWSSEGAGFAVALTGRMLIGAVLTYAWMRWQGYHLAFERKAIYVYASTVLGVFGAMMAIFWSAQYIASGMVSVLFGLSPIVVGILASFVLEEDFSRLNKIAGAVLGLSGLIVVFYHELYIGSDGWKGVCGMLLSVMLYSLSVVLVKRLGGDYSAAVINTGGLLMALPLLFVASAMSGQMPALPDAPVRALTAVVYLGVFGSFIGFVLYYDLLKHMSAGSVMLIPLITPVMAMLLGGILNDEVLSPSIWLGALLILCGLLTYQWPAVRIFVSPIGRWR